MLKLKTGAKLMLVVNIDIQDRLINGQAGIIRHIEFAQAGARKGTIHKVLTLKFGDFQTLSPPCTLFSNRMTS